MKKKEKLICLIILCTYISCTNQLATDINENNVSTISIAKPSIKPTPTAKSDVIIPKESSLPIKVEVSKTDGILKTQVKTGSAENNVNIIPTLSPIPTNIGNSVNTTITTTTTTSSACINEKPMPYIVDNTPEPIIGCSSSTSEPQYSVCTGYPAGSYYSGKKSFAPYSVSRGFPEGLITGGIDLIFKDEYKIRYDFNKKEFYSLICNIDTSELNKIFSLNKSIGSIYGGLGDFTEEKALLEEKELQKGLVNDAPNRGSVYFILVKDSILKELITPLRNLEYVREVNLQAESVNDVK